MHKISIIIPIYNAEKYLPHCLESIINQTYHNVEIILINDGSTDSCPQICEDYAQNDKRVKVIHKENGGLSDARNAGLKIANGDFISFVDNDDILSISFCDRLVQIALQNDADIVECSFKKFLDEDQIDKNSIISQGSIEVYSTERALELLMREYFKQMVWNKLYKKEVIQNLDFPKGKMNEDEFWTYKVFGNSKTIVKLSDCLYFYRQHPESMMGKSYKINRLDGIEALEKRISYTKENFPKLENLATKVFCFGSMAHYQRICDNREIDPQKIFRRKIIANVKKYNQIEVIKKWDWKAIFWYQLFLIAPNVFVKIRNLNETRVKMIQHKQLK